jgi:2-hydroxychromene-2-carboxylate isomerase
VAEAAATLYYDVTSPYAYLAAYRIGDVLPDATWRPIAFPFLLQQLGRVPWPLDPDMDEDAKEQKRQTVQEEVTARAADRGMPPLRFPEGFPVATWSFAPLRAAVFAEEQGKIEEFSLECFRLEFAEGRSPAELETMLDAAQGAGLDPDEVIQAIERQDIKDRLREYTDEAFERGVTGIPTVAIGDELYWGDDRLDEAVAAMAP